MMSSRRLSNGDSESRHAKPDSDSLEKEIEARMIKFETDWKRHREQGESPAAKNPSEGTPNPSASQRLQQRAAEPCGSISTPLPSQSHISRHTRSQIAGGRESDSESSPDSPGRGAGTRRQLQLRRPENAPKAGKKARVTGMVATVKQAYANVTACLFLVGSELLSFALGVAASIAWGLTYCLRRGLSTFLTALGILGVMSFLSYQFSCYWTCSNYYPHGIEYFQLSQTCSAPQKAIHPTSHINTTTTAIADLDEDYENAALDLAYPRSNLTRFPVEYLVMARHLEDYGMPDSEQLKIDLATYVQHNDEAAECIQDFIFRLGRLVSRLSLRLESLLDFVAAEADSPTVLWHHVLHPLDFYYPRARFDLIKELYIALSYQAISETSTAYDIGQKCNQDLHNIEGSWTAVEFYLQKRGPAIRQEHQDVNTWGFLFLNPLFPEKRKNIQRGSKSRLDVLNKLNQFYDATSFKNLLDDVGSVLRILQAQKIDLAEKSSPTTVSLETVVKDLAENLRKLTRSHTAAHQKAKDAQDQIRKLVMRPRDDRVRKLLVERLVL